MTLLELVAHPRFLLVERVLRPDDITPLWLVGWRKTDNGPVDATQQCSSPEEAIKLLESKLLLRGTLIKVRFVDPTSYTPPAGREHGAYLGDALLEWAKRFKMLLASFENVDAHGGLNEQGLKSLKNLRDEAPTETRTLCVWEEVPW